jgi:hypothetical protein
MRDWTGIGAALAAGMLIGSAWVAMAQEASPLGVTKTADAAPEPAPEAPKAEAKAVAEPAPEVPIEAPPATPGRTRCAMFERPIAGISEVDTADEATPLGKWVAAHVAKGWSLGEVSMSAAQKPTGYPIAWTHVCVSGR